MSTNETTTSTITVAGMTCGHCVSSVKEQIGKIDGVESVDVDLASGVVTVESATPTPDAALEAAIADAGYEVAT
ncbi:MAG TPA: copper ion binding protein [Acidimicrobiales bacterium]|nr:copper ion binding protein [Acidimicrobiales bacterium]